MFETVVQALAVIDRDVTDAERVDQLTALERVKAVCAAAQARITADLAASQEDIATAWRARAQECADVNDFEGWRAAREQARRATVILEQPPHDGGDGRRVTARRPGADLGVAGQVALARRESPSRGSRHLGMALALVRQLPRTLAALDAGVICEWRAEIIVRETAVLTPDQQTMVDAELFKTLDDDDSIQAMTGVGMWGDRELQRRVRAIAYRLDAQSVLARARGAQCERRVTLRPAPDTMSYLTAYLPVAQGVAVHAALTAAAATAHAGGDERTKGQVMADTLVERATGQATADAVPVEVQVVMTDRALLTNVFGTDATEAGYPVSETPAQVPGYGTVPAAWARDLLTNPNAQAWVRRLYTHPDDGTLVAMDSHRRTFTGGLRRFLIARDGSCRTPWCDAPVSHLDHAVDHAIGGLTTAHNGQGLCVRCNHTKQQPGWHARPEPAPPSEDWRRHTVVLTTPTGHTYRSTAPPVLPGLPGLSGLPGLPGLAGLSGPPGLPGFTHNQPSVLERHWETVLAA